MKLNVTQTTDKKLEDALGISKERTMELCFHITSAVNGSIIMSQMNFREMSLAGIYEKVALGCDTNEELVFAVDMTLRLLMQHYSHMPTMLRPQN